ncbi:hypothetical protein T11_9733 [Trichinella zimbabwensis]|uniref:Uncharacterized protein n=1 Tax=Trichinella zimbabwensis TaxID=268475 RepID=A0A0V1HES2_9BILA|nr:hypothetical protein T11_9733 [Trichinella zimbabwensis]
MIWREVTTKNFPPPIHHFSHFVRIHAPAPTPAPAAGAHAPDMTSSSFDLTVESMNLMLSCSFIGFTFKPTDRQAIDFRLFFPHFACTNLRNV